jgi:hypothetical protein
MSDGWYIERVNMHECDLLLQVERLGISQWNDTSLRADDIRNDVQDESVLRKFASEVPLPRAQAQTIGRHRLTVVDDLLSYPAIAAPTVFLAPRDASIRSAATESR